ncbi:4Fe-4S dicluster domain-containing protein [Candidatus Izimaplasma bacterium ZiA1]|uniref:4Fe-4S dicluster domain-containing protein n=1 Tax=Candidatus Izimoplasma sp. ZiA1 TaxID=2024899 RepID=UPI00143AE83C
MKKYDERNTLFSRVSLIEGTKEYNEYYKNLEDQKELDDPLRNLPFRDKLKKDQDYKNMFYPLIESNKYLIKDLYNRVQKTEIKPKVKLPQNFTNNIKEITKYFGATNVGITKLTDNSYYEIAGGLTGALGFNNYNEKIKNKYSTAIVYTIKMDKEMINRAPFFEELLATENAYYKVANTGSRLALYLKNIGYDAFSNNSEYYLAPLVPLAYDAGLGEIGMCNHLVTVDNGNNVRLGAVFTNLELEADHPIDFGLNAFCKRCSLCMMNCPSKAITHKERIVNGRRFFKFTDTKCFKMWTSSGTDCGICIESCPFTQGVSIEDVKKMKDDQDVMDDILAKHIIKNGRRKFTKGDLPIVRRDS